MGRVVRVCSLHTVSVLVVRRTRHPRYLKLVTKSKKYLAHDPRAVSCVGESVRIQACAPVSKRKRWCVLF
ncbi:MAG: 30S ribosomal protein S17 [Candidatus Hodgkinia cicadicola]